MTLIAIGEMRVEEVRPRGLKGNRRDIALRRVKTCVFNAEGRDISLGIVPTLGVFLVKKKATRPRIVQGSIGGLGQVTVKIIGTVVGAGAHEG